MLNLTTVLPQIAARQFNGSELFTEESELMGEDLGVSSL